MSISRGKSIAKIILHVFSVLLFVFATSYALLAAYGYQIDLLHKNIFKTSIVDLVGTYNDIHVYMDSEEVSDRIPYQIKNIKPGTYTINIDSEKFNNWKRTVSVVEDLVTIINDIYLVPKDLKIKTVFDEFDFIYDDMVFNGKTIVFVNKEKGLLHEFNIDGGIEEEIKTTTLLNKIQYEKVYSAGDKYIVFDGGKEGDHEVNLLDLSSDTLTKIIVPDEFVDFNIGYNFGIKGFYLNGGSLFSVDIDEQGIFKGITLLTELSAVNDIEVYSDGGLIFIKTEEGLYEYRDSLLALIDSDIYLGPYVSPYGDKAVYVLDGGEIYTYSFESKESFLIGRFVHKIDQIAWFFDGKHILLAQNGKLLFCDLTMENCPVLNEEILLDNIFVSKTKPLILLITKEGFGKIDLSLI
ncbi:hypothetical protein C0416_02720 [bacterium]|nr:hypothetical protein [bacterium]